MPAIRITANLWLIPLDLPLPGFNNFIGSWVLKAEQTLLVDVGPAAAVPALIAALSALGIERPDLILTTHIHLDHAGGLGTFLEAKPAVPIVCHSSAIPHLTAPERLWQGSLKTLGATAQAYREPLPTPQSLLIAAENFSADAIKPIMTPGHAPHHVSYACGPYLFAGEAGGVHITHPAGTYLRPATPPKFLPEIALQSLAKIQAVPCDLVCYGHFGAVKRSSGLLEAHQRQIADWTDIIQSVIQTQPADPLSACLEVLLAQDPLLRHGPQFEPAVWERERYFLQNSIKGYLGYFQSL